METIANALFSGVNYWAVIVAGLATFFLGGLWYSPALFEGAWMHANGYQAEQVEAMQAALGPAGFAGAVLAYLAMALVFAALLAILGIKTIWGGLALGFAIWLGFLATTGLTGNLFSTRPLSAWLIDTGFQLSFLLMCGTILTLWR